MHFCKRSIGSSDIVEIFLAGDRTLLSIPPLCKLNPLYEQVVGLRFRALCYLADECGEDVTPY